MNFIFVLIPDIIIQTKSSRMRWAGHVAHMEEERRVYKVLVGKPEGKRPFGRPTRRWEDGLRMNQEGAGWGGGLEWIKIAQEIDRWQVLVNVVINLRVMAP
jgi:hypothetical protein